MTYCRLCGSTEDIFQRGAICRGCAKKLGRFLLHATFEQASRVWRVEPEATDVIPSFRRQLNTDALFVHSEFVPHHAEIAQMFARFGNMRWALPDACIALTMSSDAEAIDFVLERVLAKKVMQPNGFEQLRDLLSPPRAPSVHA